MGPRGHDQQAERRRRLALGLDRLLGTAPAHQRRVQGKGPWQIGILERFPVQGVKGGRALDLDVELTEPAAHLEVSGVGLRMRFKHLLEQVLPIGRNALRRLARLDPVQERPPQVLFEVPLEPLFVLLGKRIGYVDRVLDAVVQDTAAHETRPHPAPLPLPRATRES